MQHLVIATDDDGIEASLRQRLAGGGFSAGRCSTWADTLIRAIQADTRLLLLDARLEGASGALLHEVARALPSAPMVRVIRGDLPPLRPLDADELLELAGRATSPLLDSHEQRLLEYAGLGPEPLQRLLGAARTPTPVVFEGERGTGKEWVAKITHRLTGRVGPFVVHAPGDEVTVHGSTPGTVYVETVEHVPPEALDELHAFTRATDWKLLGGSRRAPDDRTDDWSHLHLRPLRERPQDIRPLASLYLETWTERLELPERRIHYMLWDLIEAYTWPGNQRELETFIVQAATSARGAMISRGALPTAVLARLDPQARGTRDTRAYEEMVEERLRSVVDRYEPDPDAPELYRMVVDATERALFRLALQHTGGNQKRAAQLLGVARNTLRDRMERFDLWEDA